MVVRKGAKMICRDVHDSEYESDRKKYHLENYAGPFAIINGQVYIKVKTLGVGDYGFADLYCNKDDTSQKIVIKTVGILIHDEFNEVKPIDQYKEKVAAARLEQKLHQYLSKGKYGDIYGHESPRLIRWEDFTRSPSFQSEDEGIQLIQKSKPNCYGIRISMRYEEGESFRNYIKNVTDPLQVIRILIDIIEKVLYLRFKKNVMHGDPSFENILINSKGKVVLIDYGSARWSNTTLSQDELDMFLQQEASAFVSLIDFTAKNCGAESKKQLSKPLMELKSVLEILSPYMMYPETTNWNERLSILIDLEKKLKLSLQPSKPCLFYSQRSAYLIKTQPRSLTDLLKKSDQSIIPKSGY